jgi:hypothetical protein
MSEQVVTWQSTELPALKHLAVHCPYTGCLHCEECGLGPQDAVYFRQPMFCDPVGVCPSCYGRQR